MTDAAHSSWPAVELDPVRRLKVMASATKHPNLAERHFSVPFEQLWAVASDLEHELPHIVPGLRSFTLISRDGDRLSGRAVGALGYREHFELVLRPGWCLMQSRVLISGMAAMPDGDGSRFAFFSSLRLPGGPILNRVLRLRPAHRKGRLLDRLQQRVEVRSVPGVAE
ncbi:SRPBCC family protein [Streptomyces sp. NPDC002742]|uniref:SRPBCC family protein n=1 Tax=Streptomyces sp. NPDC002742 TaxID=3364663 RepID=UPI0036BCEDBD